MAKKRKEAIARIIEVLSIAYPDNESVAVNKQRLEAMSDKEFDEYIRRKEIHVVVPNGSKTKMREDNFQKAADALGITFDHQMRMSDQGSGTVFVTPLKYTVLDTPVSRVKQIMTKALSLAKAGVGHIDQRTGQVTGPSRTSKLSMPETQVLYGQDKTSAIIEFLKYRGGDLDAQNAMYQSLSELGHVSQVQLNELGTVTKSVQTAEIYFKAMGLDNNLVGD